MPTMFSPIQIRQIIINVPTFTTEKLKKIQEILSEILLYNNLNQEELRLLAAISNELEKRND
jgi:RNA binding exosome subunit